MFQHALYDPTAVCMLGELVHLASESVDDELNMLRWNPLNGLLHDMVPILVLDASHDLFVFLELSD